MKLSILIASTARNSLYTLLMQLKKDLKKEDEVMVVLDNTAIPFYHKEFDQRFIFITEIEQTGYWGHPIRTKYQNQLSGDYILNMDDDDLYSDFWRDSIENILRKNKYPDILFFNFADYRLNRNNDTFNNNIRCCTISVITKNKESINNIPWDNVYGGDQERYLKIKKSATFGISDFVLAKRY